MSLTETKCKDCEWYGSPIDCDDFDIEAWIDFKKLIFRNFKRKEEINLSLYRTDDPVADYGRWDAEQERAHREFLENCDTCDKCSEPIEDDCYYEINGEKWCEHCIDESRRFY